MSANQTSSSLRGWSLKTLLLLLTPPSAVLAERRRTPRQCDSRSPPGRRLRPSRLLRRSRANRRSSRDAARRRNPRRSGRTSIQTPPPYRWRRHVAPRTTELAQRVRVGYEKSSARQQGLPREARRFQRRASLRLLSLV